MYITRTDKYLTMSDNDLIALRAELQGRVNEIFKRDDLTCMEKAFRISNFTSDLGAIVKEMNKRLI